MKIKLTKYYPQALGGERCPLRHAGAIVSSGHLSPPKDKGYNGYFLFKNFWLSDECL